MIGFTETNITMPSELVSKCSKEHAQKLFSVVCSNVFLPRFVILLCVIWAYSTVKQQLYIVFRNNIRHSFSA